MPPKKPVFGILLFFLFCFVSLFSFCPPFQHSICFLWLLSIKPFWKVYNVWFLLSFFFCCLCLCSCLFFFQTNFPNIPFLKPKVLACLVVDLFHLLYLLLFSCFMFLPFCFILALFLVCLYFVLVLFYFASCFAFRLSKNIASLQFLCF